VWRGGGKGRRGGLQERLVLLVASCQAVGKETGLHDAYYPATDMRRETPQYAVLLCAVSLSFYLLALSRCLQ
jgi:hypothetical protein